MGAKGGVGCVVGSLAAQVLKCLDSLFSALAGHRGLERHATGRQEAIGAESQRGSQECYFGEKGRELGGWKRQGMGGCTEKGFR